MDKKFHEGVEGEPSFLRKQKQGLAATGPESTQLCIDKINPTEPNGLDNLIAKNP